MNKHPIRIAVFTAIAMKNAVFWDVTPFGCCWNRHFGGTYRLHYQCGKNQQVRNKFNSNQLLDTVKFVPSSLILSTLMMEAVCSSETSVSTRATQRHIERYSVH
jgi:hypothetical protein